MRVLVVDDEKNVRALCERIIRNAGYDVHTVTSGEEAFNLLENGWDLILTDLSMPGKVDGIQILRKVRTLGTVDTIIMTGYPEVKTVINALREGAYDYLTKPFTDDTLLKTIDRCAEKRRLSVELAREKALRGELEKAYNELTRMKKVNETFGHFLAPEVVQFVLSHPKEFWKKGERIDATFMFADVRRFTPFASSVEPEKAMEALNQVFSCMIDAVNKEGGTLNKFMGDGILALFGTPVPNKNHATSAARAALLARKAVEELANSRKKEGLSSLRIGIGINTGEVVAGYLGSEFRSEYSVIGHAVNLAARLEEIAKPGQILIGPKTKKQLKGDFKISSMNPVTLAGIDKPIPISELISS